MKDNLCVEKLFTLSLHQDVKQCPCQSFRAVKVACKQDLPLTWLKYISCIVVECIFLVVGYWACLKRQWSVGFLSLLVSDAFFYFYFPVLERYWVDKRGIPAPTEGELSSACRFSDQVTRGSKWHVGTQNAQASTASLGESCPQLLFWVACVMRSKYIIKRQLHMFIVASWKIK